MTATIVRPATRNDLDQLEAMIARVDPGMLTMPSTREAMAAPLEGGVEWGKIFGLVVGSRKLLDRADAVIALDTRSSPRSSAFCSAGSSRPMRSKASLVST